MNPPSAVRIVEVGPRDGLQNEAWVIPPRQRIALIDALSASGLPVIEVGSFVSAKRVPQMADTDVVLQGISRAPHTRYPVLVPNRIGMEHAIRAGADERDGNQRRLAEARRWAGVAWRFDQSVPP